MESRAFMGGEGENNDDTYVEPCKIRSRNWRDFKCGNVSSLLFCGKFRYECVFSCLFSCSLDVLVVCSFVINNDDMSSYQVYFLPVIATRKFSASKRSNGFQRY